MPRLPRQIRNTGDGSESTRDGSAIYIMNRNTGDGSVIYMSTRDGSAIYIITTHY